MRPSIAALVAAFRSDDLPPLLQQAAEPFAELAERVAQLGDHLEVGACLRRLLDARGCALRAVTEIAILEAASGLESYR